MPAILRHWMGLPQSNAEITSDAAHNLKQTLCFSDYKSGAKTTSDCCADLYGDHSSPAAAFSWTHIPRGREGPRFSPEWTETLPIAADEQTVVLRQRATAALEAIRTRKSNER